MNYLEDYVIYYNVWLSRNIPFYKINYFQKAQVELTVLEPVSFTHAELSKIS